jgi:hypothetical protein
MIIRKHATRQQNLPDVAKTSSWHAILKVPKLFEQIWWLKARIVEPEEMAVAGP